MIRHDNNNINDDVFVSEQIDDQIENATNPNKDAPIPPANF